MSYLVGLCGAHSTGKSTIIRGVKEKHPDMVDESQLSRAAQKALGWTDLSRAQESSEDMWLLQDTILNAMYDRDERIIASKEVTLVDRTPADVWGYTMLWLMRLESVGQVNRDREYEFRQRCRAMAAKYAMHVVVPIREEIPFIPEANRADAESREFHDRHVMNFVSGHLEKHVIKTITPEDRVHETLNILYSFAIMNSMRQHKQEEQNEKENHPTDAGLRPMS